MRLIINKIFDELFWKSYTDLWKNSEDCSPYQSPEILQFFSKYVNNQIIAFQLYNDKKLLATTILKESKGNYTFLSDLKTDVNFV